jgi:hypothetical protein
MVPAGQEGNLWLYLTPKYCPQSGKTGEASDDSTSEKKFRIFFSTGITAGFPRLIFMYVNPPVH